MPLPLPFMVITATPPDSVNVPDEVVEVSGGGSGVTVRGPAVWPAKSSMTIGAGAGAAADVVETRPVPPTSSTAVSPARTTARRGFVPSGMRDSRGAVEVAPHV